ncbi:ABC transporter ATP-binding protein [Gorillibacterium massiliense]|uniref:ABC transporter ATP-binding protein n=1 Tax=Gorillibacterium massiliense TaxID=1280390 RepID=UPI0004B4BD69|nr:ABC transporter ATP-binding protein [Gorillibacterium massiliense]
MSYIRIEHVTKSYHNQPVLKDIHFTMEEGEFLTLLGPSGCGKSTLLRAIAGLNEIDGGSIVIGGRDITGLPPKKRDVGMVFQSYALFPNLTVFDNIAYGLKMEKMKRSEYAPLVEEMIDLIDLKGKENRYPAQLSGGQQQRVALARSLVKRPKVLLLDEPLSALDAQIRRSLRTQLVEIQKKLKTTTIFVTHDQEEALTISDRIIVMNHGTIEQEGTPEEIYTEPASEFVVRFIGSYNVWDRPELVAGGFQPVPAGEVFAVRPESIRVQPEEEAVDDGNGVGTIAGTGSVEQVTVLGNILRFTVNMSGMKVTVDRLHERENLRIGAGERVRLSIPAGECRVLR